MLTKHPHADAARRVWGTILIVMGVSGSGKTTVGKLLAVRLGAEFSDADDFHSAANKAKMRTGIALTDDDRRDVKSFGWVAHGSPNETQDQRPLARARVAASEVWKSWKARTRSGQRFAASPG